jgi:hypothetical protein
LSSSSEFRAKLGAPLARETFVPRPGIEMVVDYGAGGLVCRIQLPAIAAEPSRPGVLTPQAIDNFLLDLLPLSVRGKELHRMVMAMGAPSVSSVEYENLIIARSSQGTKQTGVTGKPESL